jgi:hypothetical protein
MRRLLSLDESVLGLERFDSEEDAIKDAIHAIFQERCELDPITGCWVYTGCWERSGHGKIRVGRRVYCTARVAAWLYLPGFSLWEERIVKRRCNTPACFNPDHLEIVGNQAEALKKQRRNGRLGRPCRRLDRSKVSQLREKAYSLDSLSLDNFLQRLSNEENVSIRALRAVLDGRTWKEKDGD